MLAGGVMMRMFSDQPSSIASLANGQNNNNNNNSSSCTIRNPYKADKIKKIKQLEEKRAAEASAAAAAAARTILNRRVANQNRGNVNENTNTANTEAIRKAAEATNNLSRSLATKRGRHSAMKLVHEYMASNNTDLLKELGEAENTEAKGELALSFILDLALWLKTNPVQAQGKNKALTEGTIGQYFGQVKENIKDVTFDCDIWVNHEDDWYTKLLRSVKKAYSSNILEGEATHRDPSCRAIPLKCSFGKLLQQHRQWLDSEGADLDSIIEQLLRTEFNNSECHEQRFMLLLTFLTVGRGGELKFLRHDNNYWDYYANCLQGIQTRLKTRTQQPFWVQCAPFGNYRIDFLHAFAAWASVGNSLFRRDPKEACSIFWFPTMRKFKNEKIAGKIFKNNYFVCLLILFVCLFL